MRDVRPLIAAFLVFMGLSTFAAAEENTASKISACIYGGVTEADKKRLADALKSGDPQRYFAVRKDLNLYDVDQRCDPQFATRLADAAVVEITAVDLNSALRVLGEVGLTAAKLDAIRGPDVDPLFERMQAEARGRHAPAGSAPDYEPTRRLYARFEPGEVSEQTALAIIVYYQSRERLAFMNEKFDR